jgi:hypothetical protein
MKKVIISCICLLSFFAGKSQFAVTGGDTIVVNGSTNPTQTIISTGSCHNTGADTLTLTWEIVSDTAMTGWTYTGFCDKNNCYDFVLDQKRSFTLLPAASGILELHLTQGCVAGVGNVKFLLWNAADSAGTVQLVTFAVDITSGQACTNGIPEVAAGQFSVYPNPAHDQLTITLPQNISNRKVDIYNLLGAKVASQLAGSNETIKTFDLTGVEAGFYVAVITEGGKFIAAQKFTKQD